jgi:hypothetical protein
VRKIKFFKCLYVFDNILEENTPCTLPDSNRNSICVRIHYCDSLWKPYQNGQKADDRDRIIKHFCPGTNKVFNK